MPKTNMYVIDDGAGHTICARDKAAAYAEYVRMLIESGGDWPPEMPAIEQVPSTKAVTIDLQCDLWSKRPITTEARENLDDALFQKPTLSAGEWCELVGERYLACSEY